MKDEFKSKQLQNQRDYCQVIRSYLHDPIL